MRTSRTHSLKWEYTKGYGYPVPVLRWRSSHGPEEVVLGVGSQDDVHVFIDAKDERLILTTNKRFPYVGLERTTTCGSLSGIFFQGSEQVEEACGKDWERLSPMGLTKRITALGYDI